MNIVGLNNVGPLFRTAMISFFLLLYASIILTGCGHQGETLTFRHQNLTRDGTWQVIKNDSTEISGHIKLENKIWLMHFLHWWPLNEDRKEISTAYSENLLLNLWGMPYVLTGIKGETQVNGHPAYYVEGVFRDIVKTRFIVWNCPETNRQFLSDCNINISLNTPEELFDLQVNDITASICCHKTGEAANYPQLAEHINYEKENVAFNIPSNWRSEFYIVNPHSDKNIPGHFRNGISQNHGAIWSLITDSEKEINFIWEKDGNKLSSEYFNKALLHFFSDTIISKKDTLRYRLVYKNLEPLSPREENGFFECSGSYDMITDIVGYMPIDTSNYQYKAFLWENDETKYLLIASMVAYKNMWGVPFDLAPTINQFEEYLNKEVLQNITDHPIKLVTDKN